MSTTLPSGLSMQLLRSRISRVCVPVAAKSATEMLDRVREIARENPFVELRLDALEKPQLVTGRLKSFFSDTPLITAIVTCRRKANGGNFAGSAADELEHLLAAAKAGAHIVDLSIETAEALKKGSVEKLREAGAAVMLSFHDFKGTPDLNTCYARMEALGPDLYKIVPTARTLTDTLKVIDLLEDKAEDANVVAMSMGTPGILTRLLGPRFGSLFTFGSASVGEETAPGQISARTMNELYRIDGIETGTRVYGVAGKPISSSMSPLMLNTAFRRETVNAVYLAFETDKVADLLRVVERLPIYGVSVTMPLKQEILPHLEKTDPLSAKIGACNTLVRAQDGKLYGFNTDVGGILGPLEQRIPLRGAKILVLGAGGVARAAVFGLRERGADVSILNRTPETAQKLARQAGAKVMRRDQLAKTKFDVIVNATSYGMAGPQTKSPLAPEEMNASLFFDLVYNPIDTALVRQARAKNIPVVLGVEMFVQQGARQFEIWTGKPSPQDEMMRVVLHALKQQAEDVRSPQPVEKIITERPAPKPIPVQAPAKQPSVVKKSVPVVKKQPVTPAKKAAPAKAVAKKSAASKAPAKKTPVAKKPAPAKKSVSKR